MWKMCIIFNVFTYELSGFTDKWIFVIALEFWILHSANPVDVNDITAMFMQKQKLHVWEGHAAELFLIRELYRRVRWIMTDRDDARDLLWLWRNL